MPLREHLRELRRRVVLIALGLVVGGVVGWMVYEPVFDLLQAPILDAADARDDRVALNFQGVATAFDVRVKVSLFLGVLFTAPWWIYQLWAFVTPGLTSKERRYAVGFLAVGVPLFLAGAGLAWWAVPNAVHLFTEFAPAGTTNWVDAQLYLGFFMRVVLAFGLGFLLPVVMVALNLTGLVRARTWAAGWRWAVLVAFVFAAIATPTPDAVTMLAVAIPICLLFFAALGMCVLHDRRLDRRLVAQGLPRLDGTTPDDDDAPRAARGGDTATGTA
ncbi:twin-arginine translocase subunit TatC [Cellulomonas wangsupingiae]|uniref:Sec-independent protein translocase protein TatC n=1 Tax=Cellulomonas wangsupingiae TaxID=2968085 RepID=A0ABY5KC47_9CELL|nr:twin-arginine translocase subunit TatC [Cellulomonas wangsupingiae]MCC2333248.1 twin-arginine translocase subunit TatC [Cellulomonas wangsupingiae]UUI67016.1 twin-arginine translocase subunit TatC [Cellulomonas wangsupingiae]